MDHATRYDWVLNGLRMATGIAACVLMVSLYGRISDLGNASIYAASWVTFLHVCVGEYVLVRYLHARSHVQNVLDLLAAVFLVAGILSFASPSLWCAFFGGLFALAVTKYLLVVRSTRDPALKRYAREKVHWESPAVVGLALLAVVLDQLPPKGTAAHALQVGILCATAGFAIWMIAIRHAYRRIARHTETATDPESALIADERQPPND